jgi:hypothetical protein
VHPLAFEFAGRLRTFTAHRATLAHPHAPNSLAAVQACVAARAPRLEIDVRFLADGRMLIFHDRDFEPETTGAGPVAAATAEAVAGLRLRHDSAPLCFLEDVVDAVRGSGTVLQVDLKGFVPYTRSQVAALAGALRPLGEGVVAGSQAHWNVRGLGAAGIPIALDPTLHWHYAPGRATTGLSPATLSRHGLWDDSPLAHLPELTFEAYAEARIADLLALVRVVEWMVDCATLRFFASRGLRLGERLHEDGVRLAAWTVHDEGREATRALLHELFALGADVVITDAVPACAAYLR